MKAKHLCFITALMLAAALAAGLYCRASYRDFNRMEEPLEDFLVALLPDDLVGGQVRRMEEELPDSPMIAAVRCTQRTEFLFRCTIQEVEILHVFQGDGLEEGQRIDVARANSMIFTDDFLEDDGKMAINMSFVNDMTPGNEYLLFLDHKEAQLSDGNDVYRMNGEFLMATVFCYDEMQSIPQESIVNEEGELSTSYSGVEDSEFFIMSEEAAAELEKLKERLFEKYPREW